jgi:hypothetical protein
VDTGGKIITGIADTVWTTMTDPKKMWAAIKDSGGWDNWVKSWDPNVPVLDRFGNVLIGTAKIGLTILTAGQAKAALMAGKQIATVVAGQLGKGEFKAGAKALINGILKGFASGDAKAAQAIADKAGKLKGGVLKPVSSAASSTGINPGHLKTIQAGAKEFGVEVGVRPQGIISGFVKNGKPKGQDIKNKGITFIDHLIGAKGPEGSVGHFMPDKKAVDNLINGIRNQVKIPRDQRAQMIREIRQRVADRKAELAGPKVQSLINKGKLTLKNGVLVDTKTGKPIISDLDLFNITKKGGGPVTPAQEKAFVDWCKARGVPVEHGAHMNWIPQTPADYNIFEKILRSHGKKPVITVGADSVGTAVYVPPVP